MKLDQQWLEDYILAGERTYHDLCARHSTCPEHDMQIDRTLQKLRRKGLIRFKRRGQKIIWYPVSQEAANV